MTGRNQKEANKIKKLIYEGLTLQEIHEITGETVSFLSRNFGNYVSKKDMTRNLGHKNETYYTEEELLKGYPEYTYESLSEEEKKIFHRE